MALENEITRVAGGTKDTLKTLITKLGGTVGEELIDQYSGLAGKVTKPDKWDKGVLLDGGALKDVNGKDVHADVKAALDIPAANDAKLTIQKNGAEVGTFSANASADKTVNITVPTKASDIGAATAIDLQSTQSAVDALSGKVGAVPADKTVVKMIEDAQAAATYDDAAVKADIKKNADAIGVLNGSGAGSVDKKITDAFNDFATKVSDDGVVNSYKELIDWAATHGAEAATMAGEITTLKNILKGIGGTGESATVVAYVTSAIAALKIGDYAKAADLTALAKRVTTAEGKITTLTGDEKTAGSVKKALADAKAYADGLAPNYDKAGDATKALTDAKAYADGLAKNYDKSGAATKALTDAKAYSDGLAKNYDKSGAATQALTDAKSYTDTQIKAIPTPDVSGQISTHNKDTAAHQDIRIELGKKEAAGAAAAVQTNLDTHTGNADIHVTADDKAKWNGAATKPKACLVTLKSSGWDANAKTQVATVASVVADEAAQMIHPMPKIGQITTYNDAGIQLIGQGAGNVTFMCDTIPTENVDVWVVTEDVEDVTPATASVAPQSGVNYTAGLSGLEASDVTAFAQAISNCSAVTNETTVVYVDRGDNHRKISIGDQVTLPLDGTSYTFDVIGFNHDTLTTPTAYGAATATGKAGITFQMHDMFATNFVMNDSATTVGGWRISKMRTSTMVTMKGYLPSDWQAAIKPVNKASGIGGGSSSGPETVSDDCFLLAEVEIFGSHGLSVAGEGTQYAYYKAGNSKVKNQNGSEFSWWERSDFPSISNSFCFVAANGNDLFNPANDSNGVAFGFCV